MFSYMKAKPASEELDNRERVVLLQGDDVVYMQDHDQE